MKNNFSKKPIFINKQEFEIAKNMLLSGKLKKNDRFVVMDICNSFVKKQPVCLSSFICFCAIYDELTS
jgi:hypothetical protein